MLLDGKISFVTGAGRGIGRAIAIELAKRGSVVAVTSLNPATATNTVDLIVNNGGKGFSAKVDVTIKESIAKAVEKTVDLYGKLDIFVNNAGVSTMGRAVELTEKEWDLNMNVNAKGTFFGCQVAAQQMMKQGSGGKIINISSQGAKMGLPFLAHYAASKFAVTGLTQSFALELAEYGITVNAICPGYVSTSMQTREIEWEAELLGVSPDQVKETYLRNIPLQRLESPEDVAKAVILLASDYADYMTGQSINVTGGSCMI